MLLPQVISDTSLGKEPPPAISVRMPAPRLHVRKRPWLLYAVYLCVLLAIAGGTYLFLRNRKPQTQILYSVTVAKQGTVAKTVTASGTLKPWSVVDIKSKAGGRVDALDVEIGDVVKKNQVLARIDPSDTLLTVRTAQTDLESSRAKQGQSAMQYALQVRQSALNIQTAQAQYDAAKANLEVSKARLKTAQDQAEAQVKLTDSSIKAAEAGYQNAAIQRQQLDATQPQERASAQAAYDQAKATEVNTRLNLERQSALLEKGFVATKIVDEAEASHKVAQAQVTSARTRLDTLDLEQQADREAADARAAQAKAQLENARAQAADIRNRQNAVKEAEATVKQTTMQMRQSEANLALARANQANNAIRREDILTAKASVTRSEATLTNANETLRETTVRSPMYGVVLKKYVEKGTIITSGQSFNSTGTSIVQIGDISKMYVNVSVDETDIAIILEGQSVTFAVDAYKDLSFEGKVARINPEAQVDNNITTYAVRVEIDNTNPMFRLLRPGMNATCKFFADSKESAVTIPVAALHTDDLGTYVEIAKGGKPASVKNTAAKTNGKNSANGSLLTEVRTERRDVEVGLEGNESIEITSGLRSGEQVVVQTINPAQSRTTQAGGSPFGGGGPFGGGPPPGGPPGGGGRSGGGGGGPR